MSLIATLALAASGAVLPSCSWDHPGRDPFMGDVVAAVDDYKDLPAATRAKLKARMAKLDYDEIVLIERDRISGVAQYGNDIRDMHFGSRGVTCQTVTRKSWAQQMQERGLVYCEGDQCILVPTICRNVSRIKREGDGPLLINPGAGVPAAAPPPDSAGTSTMPADQTPLDFAPPGAGLPGSLTAPAAPTPAPPPVTPGITPPGAPPPSFPILPPATPAVPEPATWLMFGAGLLLTGYAKRRRSG
ncbi:MAG: MHFG family PEP-CTERM protein [Pelomonas sp.]|nr:MHFG family PEP-CTERM protein [Roseateles sp.]